MTTKRSEAVLLSSGDKALATASLAPVGIELTIQMLKGLSYYQTVRQYWQEARQRQHTRRQLGELSAEQLDDIGISQAAAQQEARKPWWQR